MSEQIREITASLFIQKYSYKDSGLITVTNVSVSDDLRNVKIYLSFLNSVAKPDEIIKLIKHDRTSIRYDISRELNIKYAPNISIYHDDSLSQFEKINTLIKKSKDSK